MYKPRDVYCLMFASLNLHQTYKANESLSPFLFPNLYNCFKWFNHDSIPYGLTCLKSISSFLQDPGSLVFDLIVCTLLTQVYYKIIACNRFIRSSCVLALLSFGLTVASLAHFHFCKIFQWQLWLGMIYFHFCIFSLNKKAESVERQCSGAIGEAGTNVKAVPW